MSAAPVPKRAAARLTLATFNLLHGASPGSAEVAEADLRESIRRLDGYVLALQEVDRLQPRSSSLDQAAVAAEVLGALHWRFVPALEGTPRDGVPWTASTDDDGSTTTGPTFGIALVSRFPVREWHVRRFAPVPVSLPVLMPGAGLGMLPDQPRVAVAGVLDGPDGVLTVVNAHLSIVPGWNLAQLRDLAAWATTLPAPRLLVGDFNVPALAVRAAAGWHQLARVPTFPSSRPRVQIDHVLGHGITRGNVEDVRALRLPISDHCAVRVALAL